jgi:signal transduction histidine kinase
MFTVLVVLAVIMHIAIALSVYLRRNGARTNTVFMLLSLTLAAWATTNYIATTLPQDENLIYIIRAVIGLVVLQNTLFYFFATNLNDRLQKKLPKHRKFLILFSVITIILTQTPLIFHSVMIDNEFANPEVAPGILIFIIHAVLTSGFGLKALFKRYRSSKGLQKQQLVYVLFGSVVLWLAVPITNFVITLTVKTTFFIKLSPFYTLLFGAFITYAMVTQKLFDIKVVVARAVAYVLSLGLLISIYAVTSSLLLEVVFSDSNDRLTVLFTNTTIFVASVIAYPNMKKFFDRTTNKLFYRDAYESEEFLDDLNKVLVANVELKPLLDQTSILIEQSIKADFCTFTIEGTSFLESRTISNRSNNVNLHTLHFILGKVVSTIPQSVIVADKLREQYNDLRVAMEENNIAIIARLSTSLKQESVSVGYLMLGPRLSGSPYTKKDEHIIGIVSNELVIAIQNALRFEEIEKFNLTLQEKVDTATNKLRRSNDKLKELDETKDEFISMASHQLRTPLTSVKGYISMVLEGDAGKLNEQQKKLLDQAFISSQRMVYLIADLLNVSRLRTGKFVIETKPTNLAYVVEGEVNQLKETASGRKLKLTFEKPNNFPVLNLDETKIRQVIMNFIDNAIYYTPAGGSIEVSLKQTKKSVELRVQDSGIGVPRNERMHLFTKFYRADNARRARPDGTGLGLFMAKKVIIAQKGAIIFETKEGKGSTFGFTFDKEKLAV